MLLAAAYRFARRRMSCIAYMRPIVAFMRFLRNGSSPWLPIRARAWHIFHDGTSRRRLSRDDCPSDSAVARWPARPPPTVCRETRSGVSCEAMTPVFPAPTPSAARWASTSRSVPREATRTPRSLPPSSGLAIPFRPRVGARTRPYEGTRFPSGTPGSRSCWPDSRNAGRSLNRRTAIVSQPGLPLSSSCRERAEDDVSACRRIARMAIRKLKATRFGWPSACRFGPFSLQRIGFVEVVRSIERGLPRVDTRKPSDYRAAAVTTRRARAPSCGTPARVNLPTPRARSASASGPARPRPSA